MIEDISTDVSNKLNNSAPSSDFDSLVGMESRIRKMEPLLQLDSNEVRTIGILGPPGIGKTTIARYLFNQHSHDFQMSVFMESIKTRYAIPACSDDYSVKLDLHKQFMSQLTNEVGIKTPHLGIVKDRLINKKVLVVLDDVNRLVQLEAMVKETWLGPGSRIIITTQDQKILKAGGIKHTYRVDLPNFYEALEIFCMYAFGQTSPKDGFTELASKVTLLVGRLPLGLRVMGSHFRGMCKEDWNRALPSLMTRLDPDGEIESILKFCYDVLSDEDKRLFLHIACFFNDQPVVIVEACLASSFSDVTQGLHVLAEKSLISISMYLIKMQDLLVQLGKKIVRQQSASDPGQRQFLNDAIDISDVLNNDKADSNSVLGIRYPYENIICTSERAFERLSNLQFLSITFGDYTNPRSLNSISGKLRFLEWPKFGMSCLPSSFNPKFLVKLKMQSSKLKKLWEETQPLNNLKFMVLNESKSLEELPDLSSATSLIHLDLTECESLVELPFSIGNAINLVELHLSDCSSLVKLPSSIENAINLKRLNLECCTNLVELHFPIGNNLLELLLGSCSSLVKLSSSIGNAINLQELDLSHCSSLVELPSTIGNAINLQKLYLSHCSSLVELPSTIGNAINLQKLDLKYCESLVELPSAIGNAINLEILYLSYCSSLLELPSSIGNAINLQTLDLSGCSSLVELPSSMRNLCKLSTLDLKGCSKLEVLLTNINLESLEELNLSGCSLLKVYPESSTNIQDLNPSGTTVTEAPSSMESWPLISTSELCEIQELGPWIGRISCLRRLKLSGMKNLVSLPQLPYSVVKLEADYCESLEKLDCSFLNPDICVLNFGNCFKLNQEARDLIIQMRTNQYAVLPGEVPQCFTYRTSGSTLTVKLNQKPLGTSTKFKACIIFSDEFTHEEDINISCSITSKENTLISIKKIKRPIHENLYIFEVEAEEVTSTELVFEFETDALTTSFNMETKSWNTLEIKECGILQILEVTSCCEHYESFRDSDEDYKPSQIESKTNLETQVTQCSIRRMTLQHHRSLFVKMMMLMMMMMMMMTISFVILSRI